MVNDPRNYIVRMRSAVKMAAKNLSQEQIDKAKEAIEFLSSLPCSSRSLCNQSSSSRPRAATSIAQEGPSKPSQDDPSTHSTTSRKYLSADNEKLLQEADKALKALRSVKAGSKKRLRAKEEANFLFKSKKKSKLAAAVVWKHRFVCLAYTDQRKIPTTDIEKDELLKCGLGEKVIEFKSLDLDVEEYREAVVEAFPKLGDAGGFMFYKCTPNTRTLEPLSEVVMSSPRMLKERVGTSRTYIRPLQRDLDLSQIFDLPKGPVETCLTCGTEIAVGELATHIETCGSKDIQDKETPNITVDLTEESEKEGSKSPCSSEISSEEELIDANYFRTTPNPVYIEPDVQAIEQEMLDAALERSIRQTSGRNVAESSESNVSTCHTLMQHSISLLENKLLPEMPVIIQVRRDCLLKDALKEAGKKKFNPKQKIKVNFVGEGGVDEGGPKREFFNIFALEVSNEYMDGRVGCKFMSSNISALQNREYFKVGVYTVMSIVHGGCGLPFLALPFFNYIVKGTYTGVKECLKPKDIPDATLKFIVEKLVDSENDDDVKLCFSIDEGEALLYETGFRKAVCNLKLTDIPAIVDVLLDYHLIVKVKAAMDQFIEGLETLGFLENLKANPSLWKPYFIHNNQQLTTESMKHLFEVTFSEKGNNFRQREEETYVFFCDFMDECEAKEVDCDLKDILIFCSGTDLVPPVGFPKSPSIEFAHQGSLPTSSTCDLVLRLPTKYTVYADFKNFMFLGLKGNEGFSGV